MKRLQTLALVTALGTTAVLSTGAIAAGNMFGLDSYAADSPRSATVMMAVVDDVQHGGAMLFELGYPDGVTTVAAMTWPIGTKPVDEGYLGKISADTAEILWFDDGLAKQVLPAGHAIDIASWVLMNPGVLPKSERIDHEIGGNGAFAMTAAVDDGWIDEITTGESMMRDGQFSFFGAA